jgi:hypothetical protein
MGFEKVPTRSSLDICACFQHVAHVQLGPAVAVDGRDVAVVDRDERDVQRRLQKSGQLSSRQEPI